MRYLLLIFLLTGCGKNILLDLADKNTDEAKYKSAKMSLNRKDYPGAIAYLNSLTPNYLAQREVQGFLASAYSGSCGLDFVNMSSQISTMNSNNIFASLFQMFPSATSSQITSCLTAESTLKNIGTELARSPDENLLMTFSSLVKIGTILNFYADTNHDNAVDASFDACTTITDAHVREVGTGIALALLSLTAAGINIGGGLSSSVTSFCATYPPLAPLCTSTDPTSYSASMVKALRKLIGSSDFGLSTPFCNATFSSGSCVCP